MRFTNKLNLSIKVQRYTGFTLAEVLITLGIIGVVAALTIPTLIQNYQKTQYATAAKKAYTQMNQVLQQMAVDNGTVGDISDYFPNGSNPWRTAITSRMKVVKNCGVDEAYTECFAAFDNYYDGTAHSTTSWTNNANKWYRFITADGMSFAITSYGSSCGTNYGLSDAPDAPTAKACGAMYIDINGAQKPNYYGKDVFQFYITSNKTPILYPYGGFYSSDGNASYTTATGGKNWWENNSTTKWGSFYAGRLMEKGWVMDY